MSNVTNRGISVYINGPPDKTGDTYALYLFNNGYAKITVDCTDYHCVAPAILCLNDTQRLYIRSSNNLTASSVFFAPEFLSKDFTKETIQSTPLESLCESYDFLMLMPFVNGEFTESVHNDIPQNTLYAAQEMLKDCASLLSSADRFGVCRARAKLIDCLHLCEDAVSNSRRERSSRLATLQIPESCEEVKKALQIIWDSYSDPDVNTAYLLNTLHIHKEKLNKQFRQVTGLSPYQYILQYRLAMACDKLIHSDETIDRISELCGFTAYVTFTTIFKKKTGMSPQAYRAAERSLRT